jgi:Uncharacterized protein conserved in bacteria
MVRKINIGSDVFQIPTWINIDIRASVKPTAVMNTLHIGFKNSSVEEINISNVLEHLYYEDIKTALRECYRILISACPIFMICPLVDIAENCYKRGEIDEATFNHIIEGDEDGPGKHRTQLRQGDLERLATECGFVALERIDLNVYPFIVVSDTKNPKPDPWQYGVKAYKPIAY